MYQHRSTLDVFGTEGLYSILAQSNCLPASHASSHQQTSTTTLKETVWLGNGPLRHNGLSLLSGAAPGPSLSSMEHGLAPVACCTSVLYRVVDWGFSEAELEFPLHCTSLSREVWKTSSSPLNRSQEEPKRCWRKQRAALGIPTPDVSSGFTPEAFSMQGSGGLQFRAFPRRAAFP